MNEDMKLGAVVLAGGQGSRMNGLDKGMQLLQGQRLVTHALNRLQAQSLAVASIAINANRHLTEYTSWGLEVWPDATADFAGPLAGFLVGMTHCPHPYLLTVPCDTPLFPLNLAEKLVLGPRCTTPWKCRLKTPWRFATSTRLKIVNNLKTCCVHDSRHGRIRSACCSNSKGFLIHPL